MKKGVYKLFGVETLHSFGTIDTVQGKVWTEQTEVSLECFDGKFYFRVTVTSTAKGALRSSGIPILYSSSSHEEIDKAVEILRKFDKCWEGILVDSDPRGCICRFLDKRLFKSELVGYLENLTSSTEDKNQNSLECRRDKHGEHSVIHQKRSNSSGLVVVSVPRTTITKMIEVFEEYKMKIGK